MQTMLGTENPRDLRQGQEAKKPRVVPTVLLAKNCSVLLRWDAISDSFVSLGPVLKEEKCK